MAEKLWFDSRRRQEISLFWPATSALGITQHPIKWVTGALSSRLKRQVREADHSPPSSTDVKNGGAIPPLPYASVALCLIKHRETFVLLRQIKNNFSVGESAYKRPCFVTMQIANWYLGISRLLRFAIKRFFNCSPCIRNNITSTHSCTFVINSVYTYFNSYE
jgi:hypothetical protein